jgi:Uncharacterized conserved protein (DUF2190)
MTGPIRNTIQERITDAFVESPTRANKTAIEVTGNLSVSSESYTETKLTTDNLSALKCVTVVSPTEIKLAENDIDFETATVFGVAITAASAGSTLKIKTYGILNDSSFNWPANTQLYLDENGSLTDVAPTSGFRTLVATSNGTNEIFINIQEPIIL